MKKAKATILGFGLLASVIISVFQTVFAVPTTLVNNAYTDPIMTTAVIPDLLDNEYSYNMAASQQSNLTTAYDSANDTWWQYFVYWDSDGEGKITRRDFNGGAWETPVNIHAALGGDVLEEDAHNTIGVGVDPEGYIHVAGNHHVDPLNYARSDNPYVITSFSNAGSMIPADAATTEDEMTYPTFFNTADGDLMYIYRDRNLGSGYEGYLNKWNPDVGSPGSWERVNHMFSGEGDPKRFYWQTVMTDTSGGPNHGRMHIMGTWRDDDLGGMESNEDILHIYSDDDGDTWYQYNDPGASLTLPIAKGDIPVVLDTQPPPDSSYILNQTGMNLDNQGRPHAVFSYSETPGVDDPSLHHIWWDGDDWTITELDSLPGYRPSVITTEDGGVYYIDRESVVTGGIFVEHYYQMVNITPGTDEYDTEKTTLSKGLTAGGAVGNFDLNALQQLGKLSYVNTRTALGTWTNVADSVQDATIATLDLDQLDAYKADTSLIPTTESVESIVSSTVDPVSGGAWQVIAETTEEVTPDYLNREHYADAILIGSVSSGTTAEIRIRYQTLSGDTFVGSTSITSTSTTVARITTLPLKDIVPGSVELVGRITAGAGSLNTGTVIFGVSHASLEPFPLQTDSDVFEDEVEDSSPNDGDYNGDGLFDRTQSAVGSLAGGSTVSGDYINLALSDTETGADPSDISGSNCDEIGSFSNPTEASLDSADAGYQYPLGLFDYTIECDSNGSAAYANFILGDDYSEEIDDWILRKYNAEDDSYTSVPEDAYTIGTVTLDSVTYSTLELALTDGGQNDDDGAANGTIVDPVGFALAAATDPGDPGDAGADEDGELADTGTPFGLMELIGLVLAVTSVGFSIRYLKQRRKRHFVLNTR